VIAALLLEKRKIPDCPPGRSLCILAGKTVRYEFLDEKLEVEGELTPKFFVGRVLVEHRTQPMAHDPV